MIIIHVKQCYLIVMAKPLHNFNWPDVSAGESNYVCTITSQ